MASTDGFDGASCSALTAIDSNPTSSTVPSTTRLVMCAPLSRARPDGALVQGTHRADALVHEFLQALPFPGFRRVDVALRIGGDAVHAVELPRLPAAGAEAGEQLQRVALQDVDAVVDPV